MKDLLKLIFSLGVLTPFTTALAIPAVVGPGEPDPPPFLTCLVKAPMICLYDSDSAVSPVHLFE
jgi:hypothetical protein